MRRDASNLQRIALIVQQLRPEAGGLEAWSWALACALRDRGRAVRIVTTAAEARPDGVGIAIVPAAPDPMAQARLFADALAGTPETVHDTGAGLDADLFQPQMGCRALNLSRELEQLPLRRRLRLALSPGFRRMRRSLVALEAAQLASARRIVAVSRETEAVFRQRYGVPAERIRLLPNGIEVARFAAEAIAPLREETRRQLGLAPDALACLALAGNFRLKGVHHAIAALALGGEALANTVLLVAGAGPVAEFAALAQRAGVAGRVRFLGRREDVPALLAAADVFVHPTAHDACSLAVLEALAAGLPVVTTRRNGSADGMADGREGFVLPHPDAARLAAALAALQDPARRHAMGAAARRLAAAHDFARTVDAITALYDELGGAA